MPLLLVFSPVIMRGKGEGNGKLKVENTGPQMPMGIWGKNGKYGVPDADGHLGEVGERVDRRGASLPL